MPQNLNGIVINEILVDPNVLILGVLGGYDTDDDGIVEDRDEFVELYNTSPTSVNISGWTLRDATGTTFTFPTGTIIDPDSKVTVVTEYTGTLPPGFFEFNSSSAIFNNAGDVIILSDGSNEIAVTYNGATTTINSDNFGNDTDSESLQRSPDGSNNNIVSAAPTPECFLTGTRILTDTGYKRVEDLQIGDRAQTTNGKLAEIKWIGYQTIEPDNIKNPLRGYPVLVKAGALGNNLPCRDLYLSPDHALLVDGLLINAGALVNDVSIVKTEPNDAFVYHSIELEHHNLLVVEGTLAESYMPHYEDRTNYDNGVEYEKLYPHGSNLMLFPLDYPRISSKGKVPKYISLKLAQIAASLEQLILSA